MHFEGFVLFLSLTYILLGLRFIFARPCVAVSDSVPEPMVSIILATRNEAAILKKCLESLLRIDYPEKKFELIVVDDDSQDQSPQIIRAFADAHRNVYYYRLQPNLKRGAGKAGALMYGIEKSRGEIIFITDADCVVTPTWVRGLLVQMSGEVGLVGGFTVLDHRNDSTSLFCKVESLDLIYLLSVAAASANSGKPASWIGNNMAFRRKAYEQVGGRSAIGNSLIEDMTLVDAISRKTEWKIHFAAHPDTAVYSHPVRSILDFFTQRQRWLCGATDIRPFAQFLLMLTFLTRITFPLILIVMNWKIALLYLASLVIIDIFICGKSLRILNRMDLMKYFLGFELLSILSSFALPLAFLFRPKIKWKDISYSNVTHGKNAK